jgi:NADH-quinone oxidoreductase subunit H
VIFLVKATLFIIFFMVVRWTIPRFRFDQLMGLAWKGLLPLGLANLIVVMVINYYFPSGGWSHWPLLPLSLVILVAAGYMTLRLPAPPARAPLDVRGPGTPRPLVTKS